MSNTLFEVVALKAGKHFVVGGLNRFRTTLDLSAFCVSERCVNLLRCNFERCAVPGNECLLLGVAFVCCQLERNADRFVVNARKRNQFGFAQHVLVLAANAVNYRLLLLDPFVNRSIVLIDLGQSGGSNIR